MEEMLTPEIRIPLKANIGDRVFVRTRTVYKHVKVVCPFCDGSKVLVGKDGTSVRCPRCGGNGYITDSMPSKSDIVEVEITEIHIEEAYYAQKDGWEVGPPDIIYTVEVIEDDDNFDVEDEYDGSEIYLTREEAERL